jgi:hypothetical protein
MGTDINTDNDTDIDTDTDPSTGTDMTVKLARTQPHTLPCGTTNRAPSRTQI